MHIITAYTAFSKNLDNDNLLELLALSADLSSDGVCWINADADIIYANKAACLTFGYSQQTLYQKQFFELGTLSPKEDWPRFWQSLTESKSIDFEAEYHQPNGPLLHLNIKAHFTKQSDKELMFVYLSDISMAKTQASAIEAQDKELKSLIQSNASQVAQEKKKFEAFVEHVSVGIAINRLEDGKFEYINAELCRASGYKVDDLNKMDYWDLTPKKYEAQEQEQLISLSETGRYGPYQKEYIHRLGHTYPVLLSGMIMKEPDGKEYIWSVVQDISKQKETENQAHIAKVAADSNARRLRLANDSAGIGVWEWDLVTNELIWDTWMYRLYGIPSTQFSGAYEAWVSSVHTDDIGYAKAQLEAAIAGDGVYDPEFRVVLPSGQIRTIKANAEILRDESGKALKVIGVNYDISDRIEAFNSLAEAKKEAEQATQAKSHFLANMSHEIRTPMNAILGGLQLLQNTELSASLRSVLDNSIYSAKTLLTVLNDILDFSKIEDQMLSIEEAPFSIIEILNSVKFDLDSLASSKGIELVTVVDETLADGWIGDLVRIKQVLLNLASNAVKFTNEGSVRIELSSIKMSNRTGISINVIDTGIGMTNEQQSSIFERFSQADTSTTRQFGGTGLGMSISLSLVEMMGGTITLNSTLGKGTHLNVSLPLKSTDLGRNFDKNKQLVAPKMLGKKILVAEDNEINREIIQSMLSKTEAELTMVANGKLALEAAAAIDFDLILMDIQMPEMDGLQSQQHIHKIKQCIPIVAVTANVMVVDVKSYLDAGFVAHLPKPIDMAELYSVITRFSA